MILYIREDCHLCEAFIEELASHNQDWMNQLTVVDVDDSEQTAKTYGEWVPVVIVDDEPICKYFFDPERLSPYFHD